MPFYYLLKKVSQPIKNPKSKSWAKYDPGGFGQSVGNVSQAGLV